MGNYICETENSTIINDEVYKKQSRITIYHSGEIAPYEIICGIYGMMFHTVFVNDIKDAIEKYEGMKKDLKEHIDSDMKDEDFCSDFVDKWQSIEIIIFCFKENSIL